MINGMLSGTPLIRVSMPGFDVTTEAFGSRNISFDSRITNIGTVVASGLIQCGGAAISFPTMPYVPIAKIVEWDGGNLYSINKYFLAPSGGVASAHQWYESIAIVTTNSLQVVPYTNSNFNTLALNNPNGKFYLYSIFASG